MFTYVKMMMAVLMSMTLAPSFFAGNIAADDDVYRITMVRAAPDQWLNMRALIEGQGKAGTQSDTGRYIPYRIRHSQGAQWDFMLIQPVKSMEEYFKKETQALEAPFRAAMSKRADYASDWFVKGPKHKVLHTAYQKAGMFLVEMFRARAGMKDKLFKSRDGENKMLKVLGVPGNFNFYGIIGADWDVMTIGFHESLKSYGAAGADASAALEQKAAEAAGFNHINEVTPYLRSMLTQHSDTIATKMK